MNWKKSDLPNNDGWDGGSRRDANPANLKILFISAKQAFFGLNMQ